MSTNTGVKPFCRTDAMSEIQVNVGTMISPPRALANGRHRDLVGGRAGIDEDAVLDAEPLRPFLLEGGDVFGLRENRVVRWRNFITASRSSRAMLFCISGQPVTAAGGVGRALIVW